MNDESPPPRSPPPPSSAPRPAAPTPPPPPPSGLAARSKGPNPDLPPLPATNPPAPASPPPPPPPDAATQTPPTATSSTPAEAAPVDDLDDLVTQITADEADGTPAAPGQPIAPAPTADEPASAASQTAPAAPTVESDGGLGFDPELAGLDARAGGFLIDSLVLLVFVAPGVVIAIAAAPAIGVVLAVLGFALATLLYARAVSSRQQWIGNRITDSRVVSVRNGAPIDATHAATRFVARQLISPILLFGFLMALTNPQRRAFHDQLAGSVVTRRPLERWSADDGD
ncbi:MAG: RDD family protein [Ilumatobacteraceae bacterium]|nr:RDD family protein [Ilumatobacteraceae bacterium]